MPEIKIKLSGPDISEREKAAVMAVLDTGWLSLGPKLGEFEQAFADYLGVNHAVACNSGTSALHMMMIASGVGPGDEVITSSFSFIASANCIEMVGARPVFADVELETCNLSIESIERAITPKTKAILAVHIFGVSADMKGINRLAREHDLIVMEDACESLGARFADKKVGDGTEGLCAAWGFYPNKQMTTGEGGMVTTNDDEHALMIRKLRNQGRNPNSGWLEHDVLGYNYRLDELSCALGLAQIQRIDEIIAKRDGVAEHYDKMLGEALPALSRPWSRKDEHKRSWFVYVVNLPRDVDREGVVAELFEQGIQTGKYFVPPIHLQTHYINSYGYKRGDFPNTETLADTALALPFHSNLRRADVTTVVEALQTAVQNNKVS